MLILDLIFGLLLLFAGRDLFWLSVGVVGFILGVQFSTSLGISNEMMAIIAAITLGVLGIVLAICFEWITVVFGIGFLGGGYLLMNSLGVFSQQASLSWMFFVIGGIAGMCLMIIAFDVSLIVISSLLGATLIIISLRAGHSSSEIIFITSVVVGLVVQYLSLRGRMNEKFT